ncbi:hypothetical protein HMPREF1617_00136 [Escherichia coli 908675]|nr:hypothetical protein HMPREF1617_00136 [Escherichia coli 908675]
MVMENKPKRMRTPWAIEDIRYLETHYGVKKKREIAAYCHGRGYVCQADLFFS